MKYDHNAIRAELERLKTDGIIRPDDVVAAAQDEGSALHSWFEWDDGEAAHNYRLEQARKLLRVYVVTETPESNPVRALVSLTTDRRNGGGYRTVADVMSDDVLRERMLLDALTQLRNMQERYRNLQALSGVWKAVDAAEAKISASAKKAPATKVKTGKRLAA